MAAYPVLIGGRWREAQDSSGSFRAEDPTRKECFGGSFPVSGAADIENALEAGRLAAAVMQKLSPEDLAAFLELYAEEIETRFESLAEMAHRETGLAIRPRLLESELPRTVDQLRKAASATRDRSWRRATIDTENDLRAQLEPLGGPVIIFGPNNFPFAYNPIAGGDFASAIATGNPVIAKAHPSHPNSTRLLAEAAHEALRLSALPKTAIQLIYHTSNELGLRLVSHPATGAVAFTGGRAAGLAIKAAADQAGKPAYLEMSSINPVFILEGALRERMDEIVDQLQESCLSGSGQFCTKPGIVVLPDSQSGRTFAKKLVERFKQRSPEVLLTAHAAENLQRSVEGLIQAGAELLTGGRPLDQGSYGFENTLLQATAEQCLKAPAELQAEAFGNACLLIFCKTSQEMQEIAMLLEGNLTGSIYTDTEGADNADYDRIAPYIRVRVGRLLNDKMPTGVKVSPAMNHGGPYPSTGHPGFSAVGFPTAMLRFAAWRSYDHVRRERLPRELRDENPTGSMWRLIDGQWTQGDVNS